jgi:class 3 adenylate cyclase/tetratricopeptide (TPR) repeat protein
MMICLRCQTENPEGKKFCGECGAKLEILCPNCKSSNLPQFKFCGDCGQPLSAPTSAPQAPPPLDPIAKLKRYLPTGLAEKILAQRDRIEGEKRQVTVLFCDLAGYTSLTENLGLEEAYALMDRVFEILIHKIHDFEGTVNAMTGDGIMALFGAPIALEDAPQRAIRSALAIHWEMARLNEQLQKEGKSIPFLRMRVGINTGPVVVGTLGNDLRVDFTVVGDTVNLASRMEGLAEPGTTFVTAGTFKVTEGLFRFEGLGKKEIKGKAEPIEVYRVIAPSSIRTRFDVSAEQGLTPFAGREREMELLLDGLQRAKTGRGQAYSVIGEAGVGKSRFLYEFRKAVSNEDITFLEGKCLSYGKAAAWHPIIDILKANFEVSEYDSEAEIRNKIIRGLKALKADEATTLPYLLELLSVKESGIDQIPMSPEGRKDRMIEALIRIVIKGSETKALILAVEDMHWTDKSSEDALQRLLEAIPGAKVLIVFTYRPEFVHTWGGRSYHNQITLNRLSNRESLGMVAHLLDTGDIDLDLSQLILDKTEGIPFFIEEFIKSLQELGLISREKDQVRLKGDPHSMAIPSTIQDMIMAKVDRLPDQTKTILQTGSVIEREFPHALIQKAANLPEPELLTHLSTLKDAELLYERGIYPQTSYIFRHALTREVVYNSILTRRRKDLHHLIGESIEKLGQGDLADHWEVLFDHFFQSEDYAKAADYAKRAARKAEKNAFFPGATAYGRHCIASLDHLPLTDVVQQEIIDARTTFGLYTFQLFDFRTAMEAIDPIVERASQMGYKKRLAQIHTILGCYQLWVEEDLPTALEHLEKGLQISEEIHDKTSEFFANTWLGYAHSFCCRFARAMEYFSKALEINVSANNLWGICAVQSSISMQIYSSRGQVSKAVETCEKIGSIAEKSGDIYSKAVSYTALGFSGFHKGWIDQAEKHLEEGVVWCERSNFSYLVAGCRFNLGHIFFAQQKYSESMDQFMAATHIWQQLGLGPSLVGYTETLVLLAGMMCGERNPEPELAFKVASENKFAYREGAIWRCLGMTLSHCEKGTMEEAQNAIGKAIEADTCNGTRWSLAMDYMAYADLLEKNQTGAEARDNLGKALEVFEECGADGWAAEVKRRLTTGSKEVPSPGEIRLNAVP